MQVYCNGVFIKDYEVMRRIILLSIWSYQEKDLEVLCTELVFFEFV